MDELSGMQAAVEAAKSMPCWMDKLLGALDKYHLLPMNKWRKKNLWDKTQIEWELDEQKRNHQRIMDMADAEVRNRIALMDGSTALALEAAQKEITSGASFEEASQHCIPFAMRATSNLYRETLQCEYSRERIGIYALHIAAEAPNTECTDAEVSETWNAQFWDYAKNIRDEEAMRQWGRLLAAEVKTPGSIPIKALDTLRVLTPDQAMNFYALQKYSLSRAIPIQDINLDLAFFGLNVYDVSLLESNSLILTDKVLSSKEDFELKNRFYKIKISGKIIINCILLTDTGEALSRISNISKDDARAAVDYFADYLKKYHSITPEIEQISS